MIYVCIPSHDEGPTVGLLLWRIRQVFTGFPREYQLLVGDDGSTDSTAEILQPYSRVLPLTVLRSERRRGYAATVEGLLRHAAERTDRPKRDCAIVMHADFTHGPQYLPELVRRIENGSDLVVGEGVLQGEASRPHRLLRRWAPVLLRDRVGVRNVHDVVSGYIALRLATLRTALKESDGPLLQLDGWAANAELIGRVGRLARKVETVPTVERHDLRPRPSRLTPWDTTRALWKARRGFRFPPVAPAPRQSPEREPEPVA
jgi:glycosyltransferase involved in cell wall biosynthesis